MKSASLTVVIASLCVLLSSRATAQDPPVPVGSLSASPSLVKVGQKPNLVWSITYPQVIKDIITVTPPGTLTPKTKLGMDVRIIGASVKVVWKNSWGQITKWEWAPTEAQISINNSSYSRIFYNTQDKVNPNTIVYTTTCEAGKKINFGGRYYLDGWSTFFNSTSGGKNVVALINGDTPPTTTPLYQQPTIEDFIKPYLDSSGNVKIGPKDVIYLMELTHTDDNDQGFDLQDLAILVTFRNLD